MVKKAGVFGTLFLELFGFDACVTPFGNIIVRYWWCQDDVTLMRHEAAHLAQMKRDGWLRFWFFCCLWFIHPGYEHSPYEREARAASVDLNHPVWAWLTYDY